MPPQVNLLDLRYTRGVVKNLRSLRTAAVLSLVACAGVACSSDESSAPGSGGTGSGGQAASGGGGSGGQAASGGTGAGGGAGTGASGGAATGGSSSDGGAGDSAAGGAPAGWLTVQNKRITVAGKGVFRGRGANIHDTRSCNACTWGAPDVAEVKRRIDALVDDWGANFIRLNLESYASADGRVHWKGVNDDAAYLADVVEIVKHIGTKPDTYVLVSLWVDPTFSGLGWPTTATHPLWKTLVKSLAGSGHVMFGLCNEPESNFNGAEDANAWKAMNDTVQVIRDEETSLGSYPHVITVQGTGAWARRLDYYVTHPITAGGGTNIAYEVHVYDPASEFQNMFVDPAKTLPVVIGEFGEQDATQLMDLATQNDIPHLAWTFHMRCPPNLLVENSGGGCGQGMKLEPTAWGNVIKSRFAKPW